MKNQFSVIELYIMEENKTDIYHIIHRLSKAGKHVIEE